MLDSDRQCSSSELFILCAGAADHELWLQILVRFPALRVAGDGLSAKQDAVNASVALQDIKLQGFELDPNKSASGESYKILLEFSSFQVCP